MTDLETVRNDLEHREVLPTCWRGDARELEGIGFGDDVRPWNWLELDEHEAAKLWTYLERFVSYFNARYGERSALRVPPCWTLHGPLVEELTTLAFARWQAFSSVHASIGGAQYFHGYTLPAFYERLRFWLGSDLLSCQQGHHRRREEYGIDRLEEWRERAEALRDEDLWLRLDADEGAGAPVPSLVPFIEGRPQ